jgi:hypothetical protein
VGFGIGQTGQRQVWGKKEASFCVPLCRRHQCTAATPPAGPTTAETPLPSAPLRAAPGTGTSATSALLCPTPPRHLDAAFSPPPQRASLLSPLPLPLPLPLHAPRHRGCSAAVESAGGVMIRMTSDTPPEFGEWCAGCGEGGPRVAGFVIPGDRRSSCSHKSLQGIANRRRVARRHACSPHAPPPPPPSQAAPVLRVPRPQRWVWLLPEGAARRGQGRRRCRVFQT